MFVYQFEAFRTPCTLQIDAPTNSKANEVANSIYSNTKKLEQTYSFFQKDSEIYNLNHRNTNTHIISDEMAGLIKMGLLYGKVTNGAFDIALAGTLKEASLASSLKEYNKLKNNLLPFASYKYLNLKDNILTFSNDITKIDFGGLVKEYAVDQAILILEHMDITSALINFGGDLAVVGTHHNEQWRVGIQAPNSPEINLMEVELNTSSLCTSGHSKRYNMIEDEKITHIISSEPHYSQVSIVAPTTVDAGVWSTALLVNPNLTLPSHIHLVHSI